MSDDDKEAYEVDDPYKDDPNPELHDNFADRMNEYIPPDKAREYLGFPPDQDKAFDEFKRFCLANKDKLEDEVVEALGDDAKLRKVWEKLQAEAEEENG